MANQNFQELLRRFEAVLIKLNAPILKKLNKGAAAEALNTRFEGQWIPEEVFQLYDWHDGTDMIGDDTLGAFWLFKMGSFISSERANNIYKVKANTDEYWDDLKFSLFESGGGEFFLIDIDKDSPTFGAIYFYSVRAVDFETIITKYDSLETLFETLIDCFDQGAYFYDQETGVLGFNWKLEIAISTKHNPTSDFWKIFQ